MAVDPKRVQSIFLEAIDQADPAGRRAVLDRECGDDEALRHRVEELLRANDRPDSYLDRPIVELRGPGTSAPTNPGEEEDASCHADATPAATIPISEERDPAGSGGPVPIAEGPGARIGLYKLLQKIGEGGGMGVVYLAEQEHPVRRKVALKIIRPGMDTEQVVARFEAERQALAMMDHPNIARVLDAGTTASGRPFFVMDLVKGVPITKYCDEARLDPRERLELFVPVCRAIQHAHQKGIIHRDIKPSNVLITVVDGRPVPVVIDFGIAKAIDQRLTERTLFTQHGTIVGTLEYMSPEQAEPLAPDVDTRSDIYSLGVLLYEMLTGSTPLERARLREAGYAEVLRRIREEDPPRPSTRLSGSGERLASIAATRRTEPARLTRLVRGEIDWIVMRALEKDRSRRYGGADGLARDVERYLADEAVEACPPSRRYRLRKFARRHRAAILVASAFAGVLVGAALGAMYLATRARAAERLARLRLDESERAAAQAKAVGDFMVESFRRPDPAQDGRTVKVVDLLDASEKRLGESFGGSPETRGRLLKALGETYNGLALWERAIGVLTRALPLLDQTLGRQHPDAIDCRTALATAYFYARRTAAALAENEEALRLNLAARGPDHPETLANQVALGMNRVASGRAAEAIPALREVLAACGARLGPDHETTQDARLSLARALNVAGRFAEGIPLVEETYEICLRKYGPDHPTTLTGRNNLGMAYLDAGRPVEAVPLLADNLGREEKRLGRDNDFVLYMRMCLGMAYRQAGRPEEAIALDRETLALADARPEPDRNLIDQVVEDLVEAYSATGRSGEAIALRRARVESDTGRFGPEAPETLRSRADLVKAYGRSGREAEAIADGGEALRLCTERFGRGHRITVSLLNNLGVVYLLAGRAAEAVPLLEEGLRLRTALSGYDDPETITARDNLVRARLEARRFPEAIALGEESLRVCLARLGPDHPETMVSRSNLAAAYEFGGRREDAIDLLRQVIASASKLMGPSHPDTIRSTNRLARLLEQAGRWEEVEALLREVVRIADAERPDDWFTFEARSLLGAALAARREFARAEPMLLSAREGLAARSDRMPPGARSRRAEAAARLVRLYEAWGRPEKAAEWRQRAAPKGGPP